MDVTVEKVNWVVEWLSVVVIGLADEVELLVCVEWNVVRRTGMRRIGVAGNQEWR